MTQEETLTGNKLIIKFIGLGVQLHMFEHPITREYIDLREAKYHESWDWLMSVVEKIESLQEGTKTPVYWFEIAPSFINFYSHPQFCKTLDFEIKVKDDNKLAALYRAVICFIERYNSQPK